ncbi:MAG: hypothetical protein IH969_00825 [Candidatus Krumholzibacteriota bacterium]|nr:hypothetical protein [Candidatus Krumholzibacteriota bacterium]
MRRPLILSHLILVLLMTTSTTALHAETVSPEWAVKWQEDLAFVSKKLPESHADLFHAMTPEEFSAAVTALSARVPTMSHHEIVVELAVIVALVRDGHTRLTLPMVEGTGFFRGHSKTPAPKDPALLFHHYPIRLYIYSDGLFVERISAELGGKDKALTGARVRRIGTMSAEEAMAAVSPVVQRDNEAQVKHLLPSRLVVPEILAARGVIDDMDRAVFVLETRDGKEHTLALAPVPDGTEVEWVDAREDAYGDAREDAHGDDTPLYLRDRRSNYWFEYLPGERTVFFQYNEVYDMDDESIADFAVRMTEFIDSHEVDRLVIDLRFNPGGNNDMNRSLLHALIRCPRVQAPGSLFAIVGRGTFSAAMMFALDLEKHTHVIFVGEPTGASPNNYGDSRKMKLPETGLTIRASSLYWQYGGPQDDRPWIPPHIPTALSSEDYRLGRDPALAAILTTAVAKPTRDIGGSWAGRVRNYVIHVNFARGDKEWTATIDFPDYEAMGLPMQNIRYDAPRIHFELLDEGELISFDGEARGGRIIGSATMGGLSYPYALSRKQ